jgi:ribosomal protein L25 (general stress protein Ctc)
MTTGSRTHPRCAQYSPTQDRTPTEYLEQHAFFVAVAPHSASRLASPGIVGHENAAIAKAGQWDSGSHELQHI